MITLFGKTNCKYTAKAVAALDACGLSFMKKNIAGKQEADELITLGGKRQVPFLVDGEVKMYESDDIVAYLMKTYGKGKAAIPSGIRVHTAGGVCPS